MERDIILPSEPVDPQLVVLAYLIDGAPAEVFISKLLPLDADTIDYGVPSAMVKLYRNDSLETTLLYSLIYGSNCGEVGPSGRCPFSASKHISPDSLQLQDGAVYRIEVEAAGFPTVSSEAVVFNRNLQNLSIETVVTDTVTGSRQRKALTIDTIAIDYDYTGGREDLLYLYLDFDFRDSRSVYNDWLWGINGPVADWRIPLNTAGGKQVFVQPGPAIDQRPVGFPIDRSFTVNITRYPAEYLRFYETVTAQDLTVSGIYAGAPSSIPTNMTGGLGYFVILEHYVGDLFILQ
ncbi:DUF4249 family protein [Neolewinella xylanilytica]|uniref:DUF4249 family protein n=1 Tax=Neolewinella xylanilytica TaxID=1514080 RepID=UPI00147583D9|nr:DUF4249 family protein [Neolewinella xylanilytica]